MARRASDRTAKDVAHPAHGVDERGTGRIGLDLPAQPVDMDIHRPGLAAVVVAPDVLEQLVAGKDLAWLANEEGQQLERLRLDRERLAVAQEPVSGEVHLDPAEIDDIERGGVGPRDLLGPPEEGPDAGRELAQAEEIGRASCRERVCVPV